MNWEEACQIFGIPATSTPDEIHAQYIYKAQLLHPDKTTGLPERVRQKAEEELKRVNAAYSVLKDQKNNKEIAPPKLSVSPRQIRFKDIEPGQKKTTTIEIESIGGAYTKFWIDDSPSQWLKVVEVKSNTNEPLPLEVTIEATGTVSGKQGQCLLPIRLENEKTKTRDEVIVKIEIWTMTSKQPGRFTVFGIPIRNPFRRPKKPPPQFTPPSRPRQGQKIFVTSDTHFDHTNIIRYCNRPFKCGGGSPDVQLMNRTLVRNWNQVVGQNDIVYFLGDLVYGRGAKAPGYWLRQLNGHKIMIRGSHDQRVRGAKNIVIMSHNGIKFLLVHDPADVRNWNSWVIHGHKHTDSRGNCPNRYPFINGRDKTINVNVEFTGFKPVNLDYVCSLGLDKIKRMDFLNSIPERIVANANIVAASKCA
jgi:calcineurin-like phosphoesterase family protein/curved DNA-binding protein CbpA